MEQFHDYLERSFLPGRSFVSPADFNAQLQGWLERANTRQHRVLGCRPADRIDADRASMLALPPVAPVVGWRSSQRLLRDHYVCLDSNDYSVHPSVIGRGIEIIADPHLRGPRSRPASLTWEIGGLAVGHDRALYCVCSTWSSCDC